MKTQKTDRFLTYFGKALPDADKLGPVGHEDTCWEIQIPQIPELFWRGPTKQDELQSVGHEDTQRTYENADF